MVGSNLVHETNCVISMPEFALRLQISVDDPITAQLFGIFDTVRNLFMIESLSVHLLKRLKFIQKLESNNKKSIYEFQSH